MNKLYIVKDLHKKGAKRFVFQKAPYPPGLREVPQVFLNWDDASRAARAWNRCSKWYDVGSPGHTRHLLNDAKVIELQQL